MDNAGAAFIDRAGIAEELSGLSPRNFHIQDSQLAVSRLSFHLSHAVAGRTQRRGQFYSFAGDECCQLVTKGQALFNRYSEESSAREAQAISQGINRMIHVQQDLGDRTHVHDGLEKTEDSRKRAAALDNGDGANGVQRHVGYSSQHDQAERDENSTVQGRIVSASNRSDASRSRRIQHPSFGSVARSDPLHGVFLSTGWHL